MLFAIRLRQALSFFLTNGDMKQNFGKKKQQNAVIALFEEERKRDDEIDRLQSKKIETLQSIEDQFEEHVKTGLFMDEVMSKVATDHIRHSMEAKQKKEKE